MCQNTYAGIGFNPLAAEGIYICPMNRLRIATRSALHIYVRGTSPTLLESVFDTLSPSAAVWKSDIHGQRYDQISGDRFHAICRCPAAQA